MVEDKLPKIDTGQEEIKRDERDRDWKYKNNNHHNHTANVSIERKKLITCHHIYRRNLSSRTILENKPQIVQITNFFFSPTN
jgi:hypothetical protein